MLAPKNPSLNWLFTGREIFPTMLTAIATAKKSIQLETYTYSTGKIGRQFLEALLAAVQRGVRVRVMVDDAGSWFLPSNFFKPLTDAGAEVRRFNPLNHWRFGVRNHRKLMVCDDSVAFIGGFNVADE
jgi:cardiolipin synthase